MSLWLKIIKQILDLTLYPLWDLDESSDFQALHSNKFECRVLSSCSYFTGSVLRKNNKNLLSFKVKHRILRQSQKHWSIFRIFLTNSIKKFTKLSNTSVYHELNWFFNLKKNQSCFNTSIFLLIESPKNDLLVLTTLFIIR